MTCDDAMVVVHLDRPGERSEKEEQALADHLRTCQSCREELDRIRRTRGAMDLFTKAGVPSVNVAAETSEIMRTIARNPRRRTTLPDIILHLAGRRSVQFTYGLAAVIAVVTLAFELTVLLPKPHEETARGPGAYVAYTVDTSPVAGSARLALPEEIRSAIHRQPRLSVKQHELDRVFSLAGQSLINSFNLTHEQRKQIDQVVTALQKNSAISITFGMNGG